MEAYCLAGMFKSFKGEHEIATEFLTDARDIAVAADEHEYAAKAYDYLSDAHRRAGQTVEAVSATHECYRIVREHSVYEVEAAVLAKAVSLHMDAGEFQVRSRDLFFYLLVSFLDF